MANDKRAILRPVVLAESYARESTCQRIIVIRASHNVWCLSVNEPCFAGYRRTDTLKAMFKGPFESAGCSYELDGWVSTDLQRGQRIKWCPTGKQTFRWDVIENQWVPSTESRDEFLTLAREYQAKIKQRG